MNEFYVDFSSRSCLDLHPENRANNFRISWQTAKELTGGGWKVALTALRYNNFHCIANTRFGIIYERLTPVTSTFVGKLSIIDNKPVLKFDLPPPANIQLPRTRTTGDERILILSDVHKTFNMTFDSIDDAKKYGFRQKKIHKTILGKVEAEKRILNDVALPSHPAPPPPPPVNVKFEFIFQPILTATPIYLDDNLRGPWDPVGFCQTLINTFHGVFVEASYEAAAKQFKITVAKDIIAFTFTNGFNIALGFNKEVYAFGTLQLDHRTITADFFPSLFGSIPSLKFLSNVVEPSIFGGKEVRLLKYVETKPNEHQIGEKVFRELKYPEYRSVALTSINTIEIAVTTEHNEPVPFIDGSITAVTLHFKKNDN